MTYRTLSVIVTAMWLGGGCEKPAANHTSNVDKTTHTEQAMNTTDKNATRTDARDNADVAAPSVTPGAARPAATKPTLLAATGDYVEYAVGNPSFRGRTTVRIEQSGRVQVKFEQGSARKQYEEVIPAAELDPIAVRLRANDPRGLESKQTVGVPDEARISLTVSSNSNTVVRELWDNEQWNMPRLRELVVLFNELATRVSKGKVTH